MAIREWWVEKQREREIQARAKAASRLEEIGVQRFAAIGTFATSGGALGMVVTRAP